MNEFENQIRIQLKTKPIKLTLHAHQEMVEGRFVHIVCTTELPDLVIITVYEPKPPKWETPFKRGKTS